MLFEYHTALPSLGHSLLVCNVWCVMCGLCYIMSEIISHNGQVQYNDSNDVNFGAIDYSSFRSA